MPKYDKRISIMEKIVWYCGEINNRISIPRHGGTLAKGTARGILAEAGYSPEDLMEWRRQ